ncbi:myoD family inhibitor domain-containing protein isoform X3 [Gadus morhua]|uniref:MyoD family inhibitor domain containing n=1 Tax=Gadus morhua TaxID=8049 RepID=A0A8C5A3U7_GADMO|nr:myoD family inhibitor domain-containing protein isoform X3 [Gadus morhua]
MSKETVLPPDGSAEGLDPHQEVHSRLSGCHDDGEGRPSGSTKRTKKTQSPRGPPSKGHVTQEEEEEEPVRTQPQRSPSEPGQRDASRCHNGLRYNTVSTSKQSPSDQDAQPGADDANAPAEHTMVPPMCTCGANFAPNGENGGQTPGVRPTSEQPRRQPSMPVSQKMTRKLRSSLSVNSDSSSSQKPPLPEDCCVHCILACLFCEFLALCNMVATQASCGVCTPEVCCCCCGDEAGDDCNCPCDMDCGIMDACCESSDCLEICMECCGICFPT